MTKEAPPPDYSKYPADTPGEDGLAQISRLAEALGTAEFEVEQAQEKLKKAQDTMRDLAERQLPEAMEEVGVEEFTTTTGLKVKIKEALRASMGGNAEAKAKALTWLRDNGHEAIIKLGVVVPFGRGDEARGQAHALFSELKKQGHPAEFKQDVHAQTLGALVRELMEDGVDVPEDTLHVYRQRTAKVS